MTTGTHSLICMLCTTLVTCPWEQEIEPISRAAGWVELPKNERRRSPEFVCPGCTREVRAPVAAQLKAAIDALDAVLGTTSDDPAFDATYDAAEVLVEAYRAEHGPRGAP